MKIRLISTIAIGTVLSTVAHSSQTLYNLQLNGSDTSYSGAAQVGSSGDTWNNPSWDMSGSTTLFAGQALLDAAGNDTGVSVTLTANYSTNSGAWNDGGVFNRYSGQTAGSATSGLMSNVVKVDYDTTLNVLQLSVTGLPPNETVTVYCYGAGNNAGQGANWALAAANGGDAGVTEYDNSPTGRNVTLASSEGISWTVISGTTDSSGNLTIAATGGAPLDINWQTYTNGLQIIAGAPPLPLPDNTLFNLQLNGSDTAYSGAAQIGSTGDCWNNPSWDMSGSTTLFSGQTLLDAGGTNYGVTVTLTAAYSTNSGAWNDGGIFNRYSGQTAGSATPGLMSNVVKVDYDTTLNALYLTVSGLPANQAVTIYGYGAGNSAGQGANWLLDAGNGGGGGPTEYDGSSTGRDVSLASSEGVSWIGLSGTTDGLGNLTLTATGGAPLDVNWQIYTNGLQILVSSPAPPPVTLQETTLYPLPGATGVNRDTNLRITFDGGPPQVGTFGSIRLYRSLDDQLIETIDLSAASALVTQSITDATPTTYRYLPTTIGGYPYKYLPVLIDGNTAIISFSSASLLQHGEGYYVKIDQGAILDSVGDAYPEIDDNTTWAFTVEASGPDAGDTSLLVAADGSGDFTTVQGAIEHVSTANSERVTITVTPGTYYGYVVINNRPLVTLRGGGAAPEDTRIAYLVNNSVFQLAPVSVHLGQRGVMAIEGSDDLIVSNLTVQNLTADGGTQAEAIVTRQGTDRCIFNNIRALSFQDTLLMDGTVYFKDCSIEGDVDFVWGYGTAFFQDCEVKCLNNPGVNFQARTDSPSKLGFFFVDCAFTADASVASNSIPMNRIDPAFFPDSMVVLIDCAMDSHMTGSLWQLDGGAVTAPFIRVWEYQSTDLEGTPIDVSTRPTYNHIATGVGGSTVLDNQQIDFATADYFRDPANVFSGWSPSVPSYTPYEIFCFAFGLSPDSDGLPTEDFDRDGVLNVFEFIHGGQPKAADTASIQPVLETGEGGTSLEYAFDQLTAAASEFSIKVQTSPDLTPASWSNALDGVGGVSVSVDPVDSEYDRITVSIPLDGEVLFVRLSAE